MEKILFICDLFFVNNLDVFRKLRRVTAQHSVQVLYLHTNPSCKAFASPRCGSSRFWVAFKSKTLRKDNLAQALALSEQNKEVVRADKLQRLHTLHNLAKLLKRGGAGLAGVPPSLRDSQLESEAQSLRDGYLAESLAKLSVASREYEECLVAMESNSQGSDQPGRLHGHFPCSLDLSVL